MIQKEHSIRKCREILDHAKAKEEAEIKRQISEIVRAEYRRDLDKYKCRINLAKTKDEKFKHAIECIAYLTSDKLFRKMHVEKGTKYEQSNSDGKID